MAQEMGLNGREKIKVSSIRGEVHRESDVTESESKGMMIDGKRSTDRHPHSQG